MQPKSVSNIPQNHFDENKNKGWVKLYRSTLDSYLRKDANCFAVWCYLLMVVDREDKFSGGQQIRFKGEFRGSIAFIADWLDLSRSTVRRCVDKLLAARSITFQTHNKGCIIKIVNWDTYQDLSTDPRHQNDIKTTSKRHQNVTQPDTIQEVKKVTKKERENSNSSQGGAKAPSPGTDVWNSYSSAYVQKYGTPPIRNAKMNSLCSQLVKRIGEEDAPKVVAFYLTHGDRWYVQKCHALEYAVKDAEKLHMEWKRGCQMTSSLATSLERQSSNDQAIAAYLRSKHER